MPESEQDLDKQPGTSEIPPIYLVAKNKKHAIAPNLLEQGLEQVIGRIFEESRESRAGYWLNRLARVRESGYSDERVEEVLHWKGLLKPNREPSLTSRVNAVHTRLENALDLSKKLNRLSPFTTYFLNKIFQEKREFFDFVAAGAFFLQPTTVEVVGGERLKVLKQPDLAELDLDPYEVRVEQAVGELYLDKPPYQDILENLKAGFSETVLPQLGVGQRNG